ncbi:UBC-like protein [Dipodascopsis tothii]|uniref:UBC-like protein n=1 Tax=Dipodascopsis tothii TaxID=44089 RepID=UPI0034CF367D
MSTGKSNHKSPTIRRILQEAKELAAPSRELHAAPSEDNLFEWHFTIRGSPGSVYDGGYYHGTIVLPGNYPHAPPSFRFLQESGRFAVNQEICLSISKFHVEEWLPAWGIRTALLALRAFMLTPAAGAVGGIDGVSDETKQKIAAASGRFVCRTCGGGRPVAAAFADVDAAAAEPEPAAPALAFDYKPEPAEPAGPAAAAAASGAQVAETAAAPRVPRALADNVLIEPTTARGPAGRPDTVTELVDRVIWLLVVVIVLLVLRHFV